MNKYILTETTFLRELNLFVTLGIWHTYDLKYEIQFCMALKNIQKKRLKTNSISAWKRDSLSSIHLVVSKNLENYISLPLSEQKKGKVSAL